MRGLVDGEWENRGGETCRPEPRLTGATCFGMTSSEEKEHIRLQETSLHAGGGGGQVSSHKMSAPNIRYTCECTAMKIIIYRL